MTLDDGQVRELCRARDAGTIAAAALSRDDRSLALVRGATSTELEQLAEAGDRARQELMEKAVGLVRFMIRQMGIQADRDDVFQDGMLAVARAVDAYDPDRGSFSTFMWPHIRGAMLHAIATDSGRLHLTAAQARDRARVLTQMGAEAAAGAAMTSGDLAAALDMSEARVEAALAYRPHAPLPDPGQGGVDVALPDRSVEDRVDVPLDRYIGMLPGRERTLVELLYGFTGSRHTCAEVAGLLRCSLRTVDRLRGQAVEHLLELLDHFEDGAGPQPVRGRQSAPTAADIPDRSHLTGRGRGSRLTRLPSTKESYGIGPL